MKTLADFYRLFPNHPVLAEQPTPPVPTPVLAAPEALATVRIAPRYRARDFGTGYGRSSGYGREGSYALPPSGGLVRVC